MQIYTSVITATIITQNNAEPNIAVITRDTDATQKVIEETIELNWNHC